jgi:methyl-accepting chemotaxis protein
LLLCFGVMLLIQVGVILLASASFERLLETNQWNIHTHEVLLETRGMMKALVDIETGQRGFAITGEENFLEPLVSGRAEFNDHLRKARELTVDNPGQQERFKELQDVYQRWSHSDVEPLLQLRREVRAGRAEISQVLAYVRGARGKQLMDTMRRISAQVDKEALHQLMTFFRVHEEPYPSFTAGPRPPGQHPTSAAHDLPKVA